LTECHCFGRDAASVVLTQSNAASECVFYDAAATGRKGLVFRGWIQQKISAFENVSPFDGWRWFEGAAVGPSR